MAQPHAVADIGVLAGGQRRPKHGIPQAIFARRPEQQPLNGVALAVLEDGGSHLQAGTRPILTLLKTEEGVGTRQVVVLTPEVAQDPGQGRAGYAGETVGIPDDGMVKDAIGTPRANR